MGKKGVKARGLAGVDVSRGCWERVTVASFCISARHCGAAWLFVARRGLIEEGGLHAARVGGLGVKAWASRGLEGGWGQKTSLWASAGCSVLDISASPYCGCGFYLFCVD